MVIGARHIGVIKVLYRGFPCPICQEYLVVGHEYYQADKELFQGVKYLCIDCAREQGLVW